MNTSSRDVSTAGTIPAMMAIANSRPEAGPAQASEANRTFRIIVGGGSTDPVGGNQTWAAQELPLIRRAGRGGAVIDILRRTEPSSTNDQLCSEVRIGTEANFAGIVGQSAALRHVLQQIQTVAPTDSTVLLLGETGTGKELIARALHDHSPRREQAFVKLNCAAIPSALLESELFGHERGAFTGAITQNPGRLELADHGTLFLDEVGDIPLELQPKLLRVLQEREFERLGSTRTRKVEVRFVAATNRELEPMVAQKQFRSDLYYRLNVFPIEVPALRERPDDIPLLVEHFVVYFGRRMNKTIETIPCETMQALTHYSWPGNIRELQNLIERAVILSQGPLLQVPLRDLNMRTILAGIGAKHQTLEDAERALILATVKETRWVVSGPKGAAARLGMNRSTLYFHMKKLGIVRPWTCECQQSGSSNCQAPDKW